MNQLLTYPSDNRISKREKSFDEGGKSKRGTNKTNTIGIICAGVGSPPELGSSRMFLTCNPPAGKITHVHQKQKEKGMTSHFQHHRHSYIAISYICKGIIAFQWPYLERYGIYCKFPTQHIVLAIVVVGNRAFILFSSKISI